MSKLDELRKQQVAKEEKAEALKELNRLCKAIILRSSYSKFRYFYRFLLYHVKKNIAS